MAQAVRGDGSAEEDQRRVVSISTVAIQGEMVDTLNGKSHLSFFVYFFLASNQSGSGIKVAGNAFVYLNSEQSGGGEIRTHDGF